MVKKVDVLDIQFPESVDISSCDKFLRVHKDTLDIVSEILKRQKATQYFSKRKMEFSKHDLEWVYADIERSHINGSVAELWNDIALTPQFIAKNHLVYWDINYVVYLAMAIYGGILWLKSSTQLANFDLEMEWKIHWVDVIGLLNRIIELWWTTLYQALLVDKLYDTKKSRLKKWWTQIRKRMKHNVWWKLVWELTGKRKLISSARDYNLQLKKLERLIKDMWFDFDIASISPEMKVVFEEPLIINDPRILDSHLKRGWLDSNRWKVKLRTSSHLQGSKIEIEDYFDIQATRNSVNWIIEPFPEIEATSWLHFQETRALLWIENFPISASWATDTFAHFGARGYIDLSKIEWRDEIDLSREHGLIKMQNGYFKRFPNTLDI